MPVPRGAVERVLGATHVRVRLPGCRIEGYADQIECAVDRDPELSWVAAELGEQQSSLDRGEGLGGQLPVLEPVGQCLARLLVALPDPDGGLTHLQMRRFAGCPIIRALPRAGLVMGSSLRQRRAPEPLRPTGGRLGLPAGLVIGNTFAWPVNGDPRFEIFSWMMGGPIGRRLIGRFNLFVNALIPAGHRRRKPSKAEMTHYRQPLATPARRHATAVFPREIIASRDFLTEVHAGLPALAELPTLIVWGDGDFAFASKERERWESLLPNHTTVILKGAGHYLQSDAPDEFAAAIGNWRPGHGLAV